MKYLFQLLFLFLSFNVIVMPEAQSQDVYLGKFNKTSINNVFFEPVGRVGDMIYTFRATNNDYFLDAYNDSMEMIATVALDFFPKKVEYVDFVNYPDKIIVMYNVLEKGSLILYGAILDKDGLLVKNPQVLHSEKVSWLGGKENYFNVIFSDDRSKLVVMGIGDKKSSFKTITYTDQLQRLQTYDVNVKEKKMLGSKIPVSQLKVSNAGVITIPTYNTTMNGSIDFVSYLLVDIMERKHKVVVVNEGKYYINDFVYTLDNSRGILHMVGIYKESRGGNAHGTVKVEISLLTNDMTKHNLLPYPEKYLKAMTKKNSHKAMNDFKTNHIVVKQDGSFILISEYLKVTENTYNAGFHNTRMYRVRNYHYGDIVVLNYNNEGILTWSEFIRKTQYSRDEDGILSSFGFLNTGASLVFMYNEDNSDQAVSIAAIDEYGKIQTTRLNKGSHRHDWLLKYSSPIDKRNILVPVIYDRELSFAKIGF